MRRTALLVLGTLLVLTGVLWTLQGLDVLGQSGGMNGNHTFAVVGPVVAVVGLVLLVLGRRTAKN